MIKSTKQGLKSILCTEIWVRWSFSRTNTFYST